MNFKLNGQKTIMVFYLLVLGVSLDQFTKYLARIYLSSLNSIDLIGGLMHLELAENSGAFLSFGSTWLESIRFTVFTVAVSLFLVWGIYYLLTKKLEKINFIGMIFLIGGGIGNLIDRAVKNSVTDFMLIKIGPLHTGVFNVADMFILAGVIILFLFEKKSSLKKSS